MVHFPSPDDRSGRRPCQSPFPALHSSRVLRAFVEEIEANPEYALLDIGPVCGANINYLSQKAKRLYVCDMFFQLDKDRRRGIPFEQSFRHLSYPFRSVDGILLWDLIGRLEEREARKLVQHCLDMIRPGGKVVVFALSRTVDPDRVYAFGLQDDCRISLIPQPHLALPQRSLQTRDILSIMQPFNLVRSFICANGIREFLFQYE